MRTTGQLGSILAIQAGGLGRACIEDIRHALTLQNPEFLAAVRGGRMARHLRETVCYAIEANGTLTVPRGAGAIVRSVLRSHGVELEVADARVSSELPMEWHESGDAPILRDYQQEAVAAIRSRQQGLVVIATGGGKTVTACAAIGALRQRALIVCHTNDLLDQWREHVRRRFGREPGVIARGKAVEAPVMVATVQTLAKLDDMERLLQGVGLLIVDEAHHAAAATYQRVLSACPARWRIGLTATPIRGDTLGPLIEWSFGAVIHQVSMRELRDAGHLESATVTRVPSSFTFDGDPSEDWTALRRAVVNDTDRNALIVSVVKRDAAQGHTVLVLADMVEHVERLASLIGEAGVRAEPVTGETPRKVRSDAIERFRRGELPVLVASTIADEGLDVPCVDTAVLCSPSRSESRSIQRLGRILRRHPGKAPPVLYDVCDPRVPQLRAQWAARQRAFRDLGVTT